MEKYFYFWIFFIVVSAIWHGYKNYKEVRDIGYEKDKKTGQIVRYYGGMWETVSCVFASTLGLIVSPIFLIIETVKFIPAAIVFYFISNF